MLRKINRLTQHSIGLKLNHKLAQVHSANESVGANLRDQTLREEATEE